MRLFRPPAAQAGWYETRASLCDPATDMRPDFGHDLALIIFCGSLTCGFAVGTTDAAEGLTVAARQLSELCDHCLIEVLPPQRSRGESASVVRVDGL
jgi:hypothetical protein